MGLLMNRCLSSKQYCQLPLQLSQISKKGSQNILRFMRNVHINMMMKDLDILVTFEHAELFGTLLNNIYIRNNEFISFCF